MNKIISALSTSLLLILTGCYAGGCATSSGRQDAGRVATFSQDKAGVATGEASIAREFDPQSGKLLRETTTLRNVAEFSDRDRSKVGARGLFAIQTVERFGHERTGYLGSNSKTGVKTYSADPDQDAIKAGGEAGGTILEKGINAAKGTPGK